MSRFVVAFLELPLSQSGSHCRPDGSRKGSVRGLNETLNFDLTARREEPGLRFFSHQVPFVYTLA